MRQCSIIKKLKIMTKKVSKKAEQAAQQVENVVIPQPTVTPHLIVAQRKFDRCLFSKGQAPKCGAEVEAKSAAIAVQATSGQQRHRRHQSGEREMPGSGVFPRCIFNLTMNDMLH